MAVENEQALGNLHAPAILDNLRLRFLARPKAIYTYCGHICIAVNPYEWNLKTPEGNALYGADTMKQYQEAGGGEFILSGFNLVRADAVKKVLETFGERIISKVQ